MKMDILKMNTFVVNILVRGTEIVQMTSQYQLLKSQSLRLNIDKAYLHKMKCKLKTARTYLNTPSST